MSSFRIFSRYALFLVLILTLALCFFGPSVSRVMAGEAGSGEHEAAAEAHEEEHEGVTADKVWDLVFRIMNFVALAAILVFVLRKPAGQFFRNRREEIARTLSDLELKKAETEEQYLKLESKLSELDKEREAVVAEYIMEGEKEKEKIIATAQEVASRIQQQAQIAIQQEIQKVKADLKREIAEIAAAQAEDLIKNNIDEKDQERLVEEYLEKVVPN